MVGNLRHGFYFHGYRVVRSPGKEAKGLRSGRSSIPFTVQGAEEKDLA